MDLDQEMLHLEKMPIVVSNPVIWLDHHQSECSLPVFHSITHGDLTGRNILVNQDGKCWLIDFYRTYPSHILRDFVILETDIKYRLMPKPRLRDVWALETSLFSNGQAKGGMNPGKTLPKAFRKAQTVLSELRSMADDVSYGPGFSRSDGHKEYMISLLMATLNVARLRHIEEDRKLHALFSAALICDELDLLAGRQPFSPELSKILA